MILPIPDLFRTLAELAASQARIAAILMDEIRAVPEPVDEFENYDPIEGVTYV